MYNIQYIACVLRSQSLEFSFSSHPMHINIYIYVKIYPYIFKPKWMRCVLVSYMVLYSHITHFKQFTQCPLEGYETMNDKRCVVLCLCVTLNCSHIWKTVYCSHRWKFTKKKNSVLHTFTDTRTSHPNKIRKIFGQQQIALAVARRNIIYATNRDILFYYYFVSQNPKHFLTLPFFSLSLLAISDSFPFTDATKILFGTNSKIEWRIIAIATNESDPLLFDYINNIIIDRRIFTQCIWYFKWAVFCIVSEITTYMYLVNGAWRLNLEYPLWKNRK